MKAENSLSFLPPWVFGRIEDGTLMIGNQEWKERSLQGSFGLESYQAVESLKLPSTGRAS